MTTLFAWARPAFVQGFPFDHTWVTDYDNRVKNYPAINAVVSDGQNYWYCWGDYHILGGTPSYPDGFLGGDIGSLPLAQCICEPNLISKGNPSAKGTIFNYGIDGVCHQLANQVLYATNSKLLVHNARGYMLSSARYGDYGSNSSAFWAKVSNCRSNAQSYRDNLRIAKEPTMQTLDTFEKRAAAVLRGPDGARKLKKVISMRRAYRQRLAMVSRQMAETESPSPTAAQLNAMNHEFFAEIAKLIGPIAYQTIFEVPPGMEVNLVDENQMEEQAAFPMSR